MSDPKFVHLHLHTQYSLLDASTQLEPLVQRVASLGMPAVAVTDHGNMFGAVSFYKAARKAGIKPIIGVEAYLAPGDRRDRTPGQRYTHLVLLAMNAEGYRNLCRLVSASYLEGFYYRPRVDLELLREYNRGLIALSACLRGPINDKLVHGREDEAYQLAETFAKLFPPEDPLRPTETARFFVELQDHGIPLQQKTNPELRDIAARLGLPMVVTNDSHYLSPEDYKPHDVLLCIGQGKRFNDPNRQSVYNPEFYLKGPAEMAKLFPRDHEALAASTHIAERCNFEMKFGEYRFPKYTRPGESEDSHVDYDEEMTRLAREGLERRLVRLKRQWRERKGLTDEAIAQKEQQYRERLESELKTILDMGFAGYFLIVQDFINWAKDHGIPVGPGRGSAAGSLVAYAMRITDIDPIEYDLLFQRFLNPERVNMPDIDVDFCMQRREEVIRYVSERYGGAKRVCQIVTFGKMLARGVIKDVGRVMELPYAEVDKISKMVPDVLGIKLKDAIEGEPRFKELAAKDPRIAELLEYAQRLEGVTRHTSVHAAGVVICDVDLADVVPLYKVDQNTVVTQYDMKGSEAIGLIKFDFLGLKTLDQIQYTVEMVNDARRAQGRIQSPDDEFRIDDIPLDDPETFALLQAGDTIGVFQLESSGMRDLVVRLKPSTIEDVIALVALYRPGPLQSGMVDDFVARKHGQQKVTYLLPELEPILRNTYGVIVYQEQVMMIASKLANYSLGEADLLRRAMGKKDAKVMAQQRERFLAGARENGIDPRKAEEIFDLMAKFAEYGFNKSHSAAYGYVAYQTAYLKAHYKPEFFAALLTIERNNTEKVMHYVANAREAGIDVLPPDINLSAGPFTVREGKILFGLSAIKGVGEAAVEAILNARKKLKGGFTSLPHFCEEVDLKKVNKKVLENLIKSGAFDKLGQGRASLIQGLDRAVEAAQAWQREKASGQMGLFGTGLHQHVKLPDVPDWTESDRLAAEKEAFGFYLSGHPMEQYASELQRITTGTIRKVAGLEDGREVRVAGTISSRKVINSKTGERMAFVTLEDMDGSMELVVAPAEYQKFSGLLAEGNDAPLLVRGMLDRRSEQPKIRVKEIRLLSEVREARAREVVFQLHLDTVTQQQLEALEALLKKHPGDLPVSLEFRSRVDDENVRVILPLSRYKLKASEALQQEAERLFGEPVAAYL